jgi:hypothetical protein
VIVCGRVEALEAAVVMGRRNMEKYFSRNQKRDEEYEAEV